MTDPTPDPYAAQHRVIALQCACQLSHLGLFTSATEVLSLADELLGWISSGTQE